MAVIFPPGNSKFPGGYVNTETIIFLLFFYFSFNNNKTGCYSFGKNITNGCENYFYYSSPQTLVKNFEREFFHGKYRKKSNFMEKKKS